MTKSAEKSGLLVRTNEYPLTTAKASGIYTWIIANDTVYVDDLAASLFGFDADEARRGLPLERYLGRMHPVDLPRVAKAIRDTLITSLPYQENYRVCLPDGTVRELSAYGSCFRGADGEPSHYAGILMQVDTPLNTDGELILHLLRAHDIALGEGKLDMAAAIAGLLAQMQLHQADEANTPVTRRH